MVHTATPSRPDRARRRADRRRRHLRHRRRLPPADSSSPGKPTPSSRRATRPAAPGTCSATPASARTPTCTRSATSSSRGATRTRSPAPTRSSPTCARPRRRTASTAHIRFRHKVLRRGVVERRRALASSTSSAADTGERVQISANWLFCAGGYYRYDEGFTPALRGPRALPRPDRASAALAGGPGLRGKRVVVIGSGATAVTLVPAMADDGRARDDAAALADLRHAGAVEGPARQLRCEGCSASERGVRGHAPQEHRPAARRSTGFCQRYPGRRAAGHPPRQRQAAARGLSRSTSTSTRPTTRGTSGCARSRTATCSRRSATARPRWSPTGSRRSPRRGIQLESGEELEADIIVTATGLNLQAFGGMTLSVDGEPVNLAGHGRLQGR